MRKLILPILLLILASTTVLFLWKNSEPPSPQQKTKPTIAASFYPLAHFAEHVAQDRLEVVSITPNGIEPHEYEPTPQDIIQVHQAQLFIFNGAGLDPWAEKIQIDTPNEKILNMSQYFTLLSGEPHKHEEEDHQEEEIFDPHFWLDPVLAAEEIDLIQKKLSTLDPANQLWYKNQAEVYQSRLNDLHQTYQTVLASCSRREIVVTHNAFGYLGKRYNIRITPLAGLSPEDEPSAKDIASVIEHIKKEQIKFIFSEPLASPKLSETIAQETEAELLTLNPIEGFTAEEQRSGKTYLSEMQANLQALKKGLPCL